MLLTSLSFGVLGPGWKSGKAIQKLALPLALPHTGRETHTQTQQAHPPRSHMCTYEHMDRQWKRSVVARTAAATHAFCSRQNMCLHPHSYADTKTHTQMPPPHPQSALTRLRLSSRMPYLNARLSRIRISQVCLGLTNWTSLCAASWKFTFWILPNNRTERK